MDEAMLRAFESVVNANEEYGTDPVVMLEVTAADVSQGFPVAHHQHDYHLSHEWSAADRCVRLVSIALDAPHCAAVTNLVGQVGQWTHSNTHLSRVLSVNSKGVRLYCDASNGKDRADAPDLVVNIRPRITQAYKLTQPLLIAEVEVSNHYSPRRLISHGNKLLTALESAPLYFLGVQMNNTCTIAFAVLMCLDGDAAAIRFPVVCNTWTFSMIRNETNPDARNNTAVLRLSAAQLLAPHPVFASLMPDNLYALPPDLPDLVIDLDQVVREAFEAVSIV